MRKKAKKQCVELIKTIEEAHGEIVKYIEEKDRERAAVLLQECQQAAISVGEIIEASEGEGTDAVSRLEGYCEYLFSVNEEILNGKVINAYQTEKKLQKIINAVENSINTLPARMEAVFLPYKAAMWDSLESIWKAADADPDCDAYVIPIPYYDRTADGKFTKAHYEIDKYPADIPVTGYSDYDLKEHQPDMIFIHNPYDEFNYVTSVHPDFYTSKLREYTDCLVYVPYYATAGNMAESQRFMPSYQRCDYIVTQSEQFAGFFDGSIPKEKFLPLGSPKFDKVIKLCANPPEPPEEWKEKMQGRKVFFYNTSIDGFLKDTPAFLKKMEYVFRVFKDRDDVCLLWRPHPLLEPTMDSLCPEMRPAFMELKERYRNEEIGILDETADIESTIALCDAYLGDAGTSVTSLFGVVGKPMYILNNYLHEAPGEKDWMSLTGFPIRGDRNVRFGITMGNRLFTDEKFTGEYRYLCELSDDYAGGGYYGQAVEAYGQAVVFPVNAEHILVIDPKTLVRKKIELEHKVDRFGAFSWSFNAIATKQEDTYYILPNRYPDLVGFNVQTMQVSYIRDEAFSDEYSIFENPMQERIPAIRMTYLEEAPCFISEETKNLSSRIENTEKKYLAYDGSEQEYFLVRSPKIPGITLEGLKLLCIDVTGKRLRAIQLETGKVEERSFGLDGLYTSALRDIHDLDVFWFIPYLGTRLCKWTVSKDSFEYVDVNIEGLKSFRRPQRYETTEYFFSNGTFYGNKLILSPQWGNKFVELDTQTLKAKEWIPSFPYTTNDINDYWKNWGIGSFVVDVYDWRNQYYYAPEHILYDLDLENHTAIPVKKTFDKNEICSLAAGFHMESQWMPYCCYEDAFNSLEDIASGNIHGPSFEKSKQIEAYHSVNSSPGGDCGEKVYRYLSKI